MRAAALRELSRFAARRPDLSWPDEATVDAELTRCECRDCGAQSNALAATRVHTGCPNCGATRLVPVAGAGIIASPRR